MTDIIKKLFGERKHPDAPRLFYQELKELCSKYGVAITGSEFGVHFTIQGSGLWHTEEFTGEQKFIDDLELE